MRFRFRNWGTEDWTFIQVDGEHDAVVMGILGSALKRFHTQILVDGKWENLGE